MKRFKVLSLVVLILVLCLSGFSQGEKKETETADDLLIKGIEYLNNNDVNSAEKCFLKALYIDLTKEFYFEIMGYMADGKYNEVLKMLKDKKDKSPAEKELKVIQIMTADTNLLWARELEKKMIT